MSSFARHALTSARATRLATLRATAPRIQRAFAHGHAELEMKTIPELGDKQFPEIQKPPTFGQGSSDTVWMASSVVVFGGLAGWLLSPAGPNNDKVHGHGDNHEEHHAPTKVEMKDDEGKVADVTASLSKAESVDVPQADGAAVSSTPVGVDDEDDSAKVQDKGTQSEELDSSQVSTNTHPSITPQKRPFLPA
ncbi:hypothetical protein DL96DRAFT_1613164 [Flagelloscypha sp. PMI_526]|nr:hypothetical protein DL96DRAFT_1613164 [Flagelloscypha sp. PMI_526]